MNLNDALFYIFLSPFSGFAYIIIAGYFGGKGNDLLFAAFLVAGIATFWIGELIMHYSPPGDESW